MTDCSTGAVVTRPRTAGGGASWATGVRGRGGDGDEAAELETRRTRGWSDGAGSSGDRATAGALGPWTVVATGKTGGTRGSGRGRIVTVGIADGPERALEGAAAAGCRSATGAGADACDGVTGPGDTGGPEGTDGWEEAGGSEEPGGCWGCPTSPVSVASAAGTVTGGVTTETGGVGVGGNTGSVDSETGVTAGVAAVRAETTVETFAVTLVDEIVVVWVTSPSSPGLSTRTETATLQPEQLARLAGVPGPELQFHCQFHTHPEPAAPGVDELVPCESLEQFHCQFHVQLEGGMSVLVDGDMPLVFTGDIGAGEDELISPELPF